MKSLLESILSSTNTGENSYSFLLSIMKKLKELYPGLKLIKDYKDYKTLFYLVCKSDELKKHLTRKSISDVQHMINEYSDPSLYNTQFIKGPESYMCSLRENKYLYTLLTVELIKSDKNYYRMMSVLNKVDTIEFSKIGEGDLIVSCTKDNEYIDSKSVKEIEKMFK